MLIFFMLRESVVIFFLLFFAASASADIYKYTDENGVICYTDAPFGKKTEKVQAQKNGNTQTLTVPANFSQYVKKAARKYEIEPELIHAVIKTESNGNHRAISKKGAMGLMQLMPSTASDMNVQNPFNPEENIDGGTRYLRFLLEKFNGNLTLALAAYNSGPGTVEKYGSIPPISETRQYVNKVFSYYNGKRRFPPSDATRDYQEKPAPIYKVVLEDGTVLFTNATLERKGNIRF
jgi:soluble lytic murein transglycosylase-like protein